MIMATKVLGSNCGVRDSLQLSAITIILLTKSRDNYVRPTFVQATGRLQKVESFYQSCESRRLLVIESPTSLQYRDTSCSEVEGKHESRASLPVEHNRRLV